MEPFQQRVVEERRELYDKCEKLNAFIPTQMFQQLPIAEQVRMRMQLLIMNQYAQILAERIAEFHKK
jgi:hypothetical protein